MSTRRHWSTARRRRAARRLPVLIAGVGFVVALAVALVGRGNGHAAYANRRPARPDTVVTIGPAPVGRPIPSGFVGLSVEYPALTWYTGYDPSAVNPVFEQLIRNLAPGESPVLRIGGDSTDTTWVPTPGIQRPGGIGYSLSPRWLSITHRLARDVHARLIMGIDLEAGVRALASAEAREFLARLGRGSLRAFEIGNEAPRYGNIPWYHRGPGEPVLARPTSYDYSAFDREFVAVARLLPSSVPTAGPTLGGPAWMTNLEPFISGAPRLGLVTFHQYPFNRCFTPLNSPTYPSLRKLLTSQASRGSAQQIAGYTAIAARHGLPFRVDETNSVACGGKRGVSDTFASALWALDSLFEFARIGVSGVNFHMFPGASYILFSFRRPNGRWVATVQPEYYGLLLFAEAAPAGARLLSASTLGGPYVHAWATRTRRGTIHVVLINDDRFKRHVFLVRAPGHGGQATVIRLTAPHARSTQGVQIGEQSFGATTTGRLNAPPEQEPIGSSRGRYVIRLAPASAAMLTIPAR
jgi:hypothetical protein